MRRFFIVLLLINCITASYAQNTRIGAWTSHMPYQQAVQVLNTGKEIYCLTVGGVFVLNIEDSSMQVLSKQDGLSGTNIKTGAYDINSKTVIVAYENTNIDLIRGREIINIDDIFKTEITGIKSINSINCIDGIAYINCGFGVVLLDLNKVEIKDTYYLGENGSNLGIYNITVLNDKIYAATDSGIFEADYNSVNLANYQNWRKHSNIYNFPVNAYPAVSCVNYNNKLYAFLKDGIYEFDGNSWVYSNNVFQGGLGKFTLSENKLISVFNYGVVAYDNNMQWVNFISAASSDNFKNASFDKSGKLWIANINRGLQRYDNNTLTASYVPNGPFASIARRLAFHNGKLIVASGTVGEGYTNRFTNNGIYRYQNKEWKNYNYLNYPVVDSFYDIISVAINKKNNREYYGTFWKGIVEFDENGYVKDYSGYNSTIGEAFGNDGQYRVTGMAFDSKSQLWVSNYWADKPISVLKTNGQWQAFEFPGIFAEYKYVSDITIDQYDQKWVCIPRSNAILVFKENTNGTVKFIRLGSGANNGNLPKDASEVLCITEDLDGRMWVGTNKGLAVFYNTSDILDPNADTDAQPVKVVDGEFVQSLLENESIITIKVDAANRKWVGTRNGVWLFTSDGTEQIHYFNTENSPLLTNIINDIAIDQQTGEVFFGTDFGIVSYRSDATEGFETNKEQIKVFPNPVKETYRGAIAIEGLVNAANVKITDIEGKVVYTTKANGSQAIWYGNNFSGERVQTGVYLVYSANEDGLETMVSKIVFIH